MKRILIYLLLCLSPLSVWSQDAPATQEEAELSCQKQRLTQLISEMKLADAKTGKLNDEIEDMRRIRQDSLLCEQYKDVTSVIEYVRHEIGTDEFKKQNRPLAAAFPLQKLPRAYRALLRQSYRFIGTDCRNCNRVNTFKEVLIYAFSQTIGRSTL